MSNKNVINSCQDAKGLDNSCYQKLGFSIYCCSAIVPIIKQAATTDSTIIITFIAIIEPFIITSIIQVKIICSLIVFEAGQRQYSKAIIMEIFHLGCKLIYICASSTSIFVYIMIT